MKKLWLFLAANLSLYLYTLTAFAKTLFAPKNQVNTTVTNFMHITNNWFTTELTNLRQEFLTWQTVVFILALIAVLVLIIRFWKITFLVLTAVTALVFIWMLIEMSQGLIFMQNYYVVAVLAISLADVWLVGQSLKLGK